MAVEIHSSSGKTTPGKVGHLDPGLEDPEDIPGNGRYLRIEVEVQGNLLPGSPVEVEGSGPVAASTLIVPRSALIHRDQATWVATVDQSHIHLVPVTPGSSSGDKVALTKGPAAGTLVVIGDPGSLKEGQAVRGAPGKP